MQNLAAEHIKNGNFYGASALYYEIVKGLEKLSAFSIDYEPSLYRERLYLSKIQAFGLENRAEAIKQLRKACTVARRCSASDRDDFLIAKKQLREMNEFLSAMEAGIAFSKLYSEYGEEILAHSNSGRSLNYASDGSTISGIGCVMALLFILVAVVLYVCAMMAIR